MHRPTLGVVAALLIGAGLVSTFVSGLGEDHLVWGGILIRAGALLGALWLVLPSARHLPRHLWLGIGSFILVLAIRPRLVAWALVAAVLISLLTVLGRGRKSRRYSR